MRPASENVIESLHSALEVAEDAEVKFHIRQALQHIETEQSQSEHAQMD